MAAATLQKEKDAAKTEGLKAVIEKDNLNAAANTIMPHEPLPTVVSPPSAPNLNSLLTGHVGQEVGTQVADGTIATDMDINTQDDEQVDDKVKSPKKKKSTTKAPAADPSNADQPVVKIASSEDDASSDDGSEGSSNTSSPSNSLSASSSSDEEEQSVALAGGG
jgi:hypothetical protein